MGQEDYESFRNIISDFKISDELQLEDTDSNKKTSTQPSMVQKVLNYPIPLYKVAATFLIFAFATFLIPNSTAEHESHTNHQNSKNGVGKSITNDDYPEELVFNL